MRTLLLILLCLLIVIHVSAVRSLTSLSTQDQQGEQSTTEVSLETIWKVQVNEEEKVDGGIKSSRVLRGGEEERNKEGEDELVYYVDYHGVSTHPSPTPKHPRP